MNVSRTDKDKHTVVLKITAGAAVLEPIRQHVLGHFAHDIKIPGFRKGKAPLNLVEKHVDQQRFVEEFVQHAINGLYNKALQQEKIRPAALPQVEIKKLVPYSELEFEATVQHIVIKLPNYKSIRLAKKPVTITAKDVDDVVKSLRVRLAERTPVERPAQNGDEVLIDFSGKDAKGQPVAGAEGKGYPLILGSNTFIPGFENHLVGMKAGQSKTFTLTFPADYGVSALRNKKVTFETTVNTVNQLYQIQDDKQFAAKVGPFKDMAELNADIKKTLQSEHQNRADREYEAQLVDKIVAKSDLDVPAEIINDQLLRMEEDEKRNLTYRGLTWQEHLAEEGITEEQHRQRHRPQAERDVKAGLLLSEIAAAEDITVQPEELEIQIQMLKGQYTDPQMQAELDKPENQRDIHSRLLTQKTMAKLSEYAQKS